jgi:predicted pyridoxine 5'-phosphate oxidase superfamily flavin-nucleotide-binding protein
MSDAPFYHSGMRDLQDRFDSRRLADRLEEVRCYRELKEDQRRFIESRAFFFLATADERGWPEPSYKGGVPGFVRVLDARTLAFPSYDGNGMFRSLGNLKVNPQVGLLFMDFENGRRLRVNGIATLTQEDPPPTEFPEAQLVVRVAVDAIFTNCPRYVHRMQIVELSKYAPRPGQPTPAAEWKQKPEFCTVLPEKDRLPERDRLPEKGMLPKE